MAVNEEGLKGLAYYAIDRSSPFDLAQHDNTDTLEKIYPYTLVQLQVLPPSGVRDMWLIINAYASNYGGKKVAPDASSKCKTPLDVWNAVRKAAGLPAVVAP